MRSPAQDSALTRLTLGGHGYRAIDLRRSVGPEADFRRLSYGQRILLENLLRRTETESLPPEAVAPLLRNATLNAEISFRPARVVMQDYAGLSALVDLACLRDSYAARGLSSDQVNPSLPVDLVVDHSHIADAAGSAAALQDNLAREFAQNRERYAFLAWAQENFRNLRIVPPGKGILHQIHLEAIAEIVIARDGWLLPDSVIGTDSHTTMVNGLGVLGWGVGGIEAVAAMLGLPLTLAAPAITGVRLVGEMRPGILATDAVLTLTERLRRHGVTGHVVEFHGPGLDALLAPDRATIANMAPEYGATCGFFPIDRQTIDYLALTGRGPDHLARISVYARHLGLWHESSDTPVYDDLIEIDLGAIDRCIAGPRQPQQKRALDAADSFPASAPGGDLAHGDLVIAAITSCTNTANPTAMISAALLARNARQFGLQPPRHVRCSFAPGSRAVAAYLGDSGLLADLEALGFWIVGFGCSSCVGNSGELAPEIAAAVKTQDLTVASVLSGNRNFEGRIHPLIKANYLASPPLVVAYALTGHMRGNLLTDPIATKNGVSIYLADLWPSPDEVKAHLAKIGPDVFRAANAALHEGGLAWDALSPGPSDRYPWDPASTYLTPTDLLGDATPDNAATLSAAAPLLILGDGITTDHISPVGRIDPNGDAGRWLGAHHVTPKDFNTFGARRGNPAIMARGTFANPRLRNLLCPGSEGPVTRYGPSGEMISVFEAAQLYLNAGTETVVLAGKEYGTGSARDWAAKGTKALGIRAVIAESFERIHRTNLALMGVLPLQWLEGWSPAKINADAGTRFSIDLPASDVTPGARITLKIMQDNQVYEAPLLCRLDTQFEVTCFQRGGIFAAVAPKATA